MLGSNFLAVHEVLRRASGKDRLGVQNVFGAARPDQSHGHRGDGCAFAARTRKIAAEDSGLQDIGDLAAIGDVNALRLVGPDDGEPLKTGFLIEITHPFVGRHITLSLNMPNQLEYHWAAMALSTSSSFKSLVGHDRSLALLFGANDVSRGIDAIDTQIDLAHRQIGTLVFGDKQGSSAVLDPHDQRVAKTGKGIADDRFARKEVDRALADGGRLETDKARLLGDLLGCVSNDIHTGLEGEQPSLEGEG